MILILALAVVRSGVSKEHTVGRKNKGQRPVELDVGQRAFEASRLRRRSRPLGRMAVFVT